MSLSENIKRLRREKNLTQEQLAAKLGVSAQAVSKWETSETYPDGSLLTPLANELGVSLDTLFDNNSVYMSDISRRITKILQNTDLKYRLNLARDIGWQIERGLINCDMQIENKYDPDEIKNLKYDSYVLNDYGFTLISNGKEPFFSVFPQPEEGFGDFLNDKEDIQKIFAALADEKTMNALIYLYHKTENYIFESAVLERDCDIPSDCIDNVLENLTLLDVVGKDTITINNKSCVLYTFCPNHKIIAAILTAKNIVYSGAYCMQAHYRTTPFLKGNG